MLGAWPEVSSPMTPAPPEGADRSRPSPEPASGAVLFVRYAFPPNCHGYCGPSDNTGFFEYGVSGGAWTRGCG